MACCAFEGDMTAAHEFYRQFAAFGSLEPVCHLRKRVTYRREKDLPEAGGRVIDWLGCRNERKRTKN